MRKPTPGTQLCCKDEVLRFVLPFLFISLLPPLPTDGFCRVSEAEGDVHVHSSLVPLARAAGGTHLFCKARPL